MSEHILTADVMDAAFDVEAEPVKITTSESAIEFDIDGLVVTFDRTQLLEVLGVAESAGRQAA